MRQAEDSPLGHRSHTSSGLLGSAMYLPSSHRMQACTSWPDSLLSRCPVGHASSAKKPVSARSHLPLIVPLPFAHWRSDRPRAHVPSCGPPIRAINGHVAIIPHSNREGRLARCLEMFSTQGSIHTRVAHNITEHTAPAGHVEHVKGVNVVGYRRFEHVQSSIEVRAVFSSVFAPKGQAMHTLRAVPPGSSR